MASWIAELRSTGPTFAKTGVAERSSANQWAYYHPYLVLHFPAVPVTRKPQHPHINAKRPRHKGGLWPAPAGQSIRKGYTNNCYRYSMNTILNTGGGLNEEAREIIKQIVSDFPQVEAAFLFGSYAKGRAKKHSDIDLALVPMRGEPRLPKLDILAAFAKAGLEHVDLVDLGQCDPIVRFEAVSPNVLLYARSQFDRGSYYSRTVREYFDLQPLLKVQRQALRRRLANGQP